jgi:hypothetical protein
MAKLTLRLRAWMALGAFLATFALPVAGAGHLALDSDAACDPAETSGHSRAQVEIVHPTAAGTHCAICHWLRAVGGARTDIRVVAVAWLEPAGLEPTLTPFWRGALTASERPARAPPVPA